MDKNTLAFITYCISKLAHQLKLTQREVYRKLKISGILDDYMIPSYDVLHTFSSTYLMDDMISFMQKKEYCQNETLSFLQCESATS